MAYDRDEWRAPWRLEDQTRAADRAAGAAADGGRPPEDRPVAASPGPQDATVEAEATPPSEAAGQPAIARFPQPPPSSWSAGAAGPGSPVGSVRPPDTIGTVEAPTLVVPPARRGRTFLVGLVGGLVGALVGASAVVLVDGRPGDPGQSVVAPEVITEGDASQVVPAVAQAVTPSVVVIDVEAAALPDGLGPGVPALGSGVIYRSDGFILTNAHVVGQAETARVRLASGERLEGEVLGTDPLNDLAVIRVQAEDLPRINLRPEDEALVVGETVVAIGSPFGLDASVTTGIISGLNRDLRVDEVDGAGLTIPSVIQTDAAINPGNSGGALVDARGRLIGINTAILTRSGGNQGVGFAVPAAQAVASADQIIEQGFVRHPLLGISGVDVSPEVAERFGLATSRGAVVEDVQPGTGAEEAGLRPGDIIVEVDGEELTSMSELVAVVRRRTPGDTIELEIIRDGDRRTVEVTLGERPR